MVKDNYKPSNTSRRDAYEAELNRLAAQSGPVRAFTYEENMQLNKELTEGMEEFLRECKKNEFFAEKELSRIVLNA